MRELLVWDRHTRLFHWALVFSFGFSLTTGLLDDMDIMEWHMLSGYCILALLLFRLLTGFFGRDYGHFSRFALHPRAIRAYLTGGRQFTGHNPLGSWMVIVMLLALSLQVLSGLLTSDDLFLEGPWVAWAQESWVSLAGEIHGANYYVLIALVVFHLAAIAFYSAIKKQNLVWTMLTGVKKAVGELVNSNNGNIDRVENPALPISAIRVAILAAIAGGSCWGLINLF